MQQSIEPSTTWPNPLRVRLTSDTANVAGARRAIEAYAWSAGFAPAEVQQIGLVVNEALANIIRHAYGGRSGEPIELGAESIGGPVDAVMQISLRDWGNGIDPQCAAKRGYVPGEPGGLGLICLGRFMDSVDFAPQPGGGLLLTMVRRRR